MRRYYSVLLIVGYFTASIAPLAAAPALGDEIDISLDFDARELKKLVYAEGFAPWLEEKTINQLTQVQNHVKAAEWSKAFRVIDTQPAELRGQMFPARPGVWLPIDDYYWHLLTQLPPAGRDAFRLYFDGRAKSLMDQAMQADEARQRTILTKIFQSYFLTSLGDQAADLLGDAYFEQGEFARAASCWRAIIEHHPDSELPEVRLLTKIAYALFRQGRRQELAEIQQQIVARFGESTVVIGGTELVAADLIGELVAGITSELTESTNSVVGDFSFPNLDEKPNWTAPLKKANSVTAGVISSVFPSGRQIFINHGSQVQVYSQDETKLQWQVGAPNVPRQNNQQQAAMWVGANAYGVTVNVFEPQIQQARDKLYCTMLDQNSNKSPAVVCLDKAKGVMLWHSGTVLKGNVVVGNPCIVDDIVLITAYKQPSNQLFIHALAADSGKIQWSLRIGSVRGTVNDEQGLNTPWPTIVRQRDHIYVLPGDGALIAVNIAIRQVSWLLKFPHPRRSASMQMVWSPYQLQQRPPSQAMLLVRNQMLYFKDGNGPVLTAFDTVRKSVQWIRPIDEAMQLTSVDDTFVYLMGEEIEARERLTGKLAWSNHPPRFTAHTIVNTTDSVYAPTIRGIYRFSKENGDTMEIIRNKESMGQIGRLIPHAGQLLLFHHDKIVSRKLER